MASNPTSDTESLSISSELDLSRNTIAGDVEDMAMDPLLSNPCFSGHEHAHDHEGLADEVGHAASNHSMESRPELNLDMGMGMGFETGKKRGNPRSSFEVDEGWGRASTTPVFLGAPGMGMGKRRGTAWRWRWILVFVKVMVVVWVVGVVYKVGRGLLIQSNHPPAIDTNTPNSSRTITIKHTDGEEIRGIYPLYDLLSLSTTSGNITITIIPQQRQRTTPARLHIRSVSGSIKLAFTTPEAASLPELEMELVNGLLNTNTNTPSDPQDRTLRQDRHAPLPPRLYDLDISTGGAIAGRAIFSSARLRAGADITAVLIPVPGSAGCMRNVSLSTRTETGMQRVHVTEPYEFESESESDSESEEEVEKKKKKNRKSVRLSAEHGVGGGGDMEVAYARVWQGDVKLRTEGGSVRVEGGEVRVVRSGEGMVDAVVGEEEEDDDDDDEDEDDSEDDADDNEDDDEQTPPKRMNVSLNSQGGSILFYVG